MIFSQADRHLIFVLLGEIEWMDGMRRHVEQVEWEWNVVFGWMALLFYTRGRLSL